MADTQKASELEEKITYLVLQTRNILDREDRDKLIKRVNEYARQYFEMTGKHYNITKVFGEYGKSDRQ